MTANSMTAFARHLHISPTGQFVWELRSVNHRYLEIGLRLPDALRALEPAVRDQLQQRLNRGKVDGLLRLQTDATAFDQWQLNQPLIERLIRLTGEVEQLTGPGQSLAPMDLLRWPGALIEPALDDRDDLAHDALAGLAVAIDQLLAHRQREGQQLAQFIGQRVSHMGELVAAVRQHRPTVLARWRDKLLARLADLPIPHDNGRLEQELVLMAQRLDVDEELDRLDAHLAEITAVLRRSEPVGRRLDFLTQELNREANTLSAKANDSVTTQHAIDLKVLIEQIREQVQNLE